MDSLTHSLSTPRRSRTCVDRTHLFKTRTCIDEVRATCVDHAAPRPALLGPTLDFARARRCRRLQRVARRLFRGTRHSCFLSNPRIWVAECGELLKPVASETDLPRGTSAFAETMAREMVLPEEIVASRREVYGCRRPLTDFSLLESSNLNLRRPQSPRLQR